MPFFRGQKVVYIGPDFRGQWFAAAYRMQLPVPDAVYRTRSSELFAEGSPGYLLEGVSNPHVHHNGQEMIIDAKWLRPVDEVKDQAFFTQGAPSDTKWLDNRRQTAETVLAMNEVEFEKFLLRQTKRRAAWRPMSS